VNALVKGIQNKMPIIFLELHQLRSNIVILKKTLAVMFKGRFFSKAITILSSTKNTESFNK